MIRSAAQCLICGSVDFKALGKKHGRTVVKCDPCGLIRTLERTDDYIELYTEGDTYHVERDGQIPYRERFEHDINVGLSRLAAFKEVSRPRWLDVGSANGGFLVAARSQGFAIEGLELNPGMAAWAEEASYVTVHTSWKNIEGLFDVISLHDVIEHVEDPDAELRRLRAHLTATGFLILDTPDAGHSKFAAAPMESRHTKPLEHLWFFREQDLRTLLLRTGYIVQAVDHPIPGKLVIYARPRLK
jgi:2-polyprenyl-3-methyl-5-hydroxy-6-metoxy-1,4-benzoquinol methylase